MRIEYVSLALKNNNRVINKKNNSPSFGELKCVPGDEVLLSLTSKKVLNNEKLLLSKVKKSGKILEGANELFEVIISERARERALLKKQREKEDLKKELYYAYVTQEAAYISPNVSNPQREYYLNVAKSRINDINIRLTQYEDFRDANMSRYKTLGKVAKALTKKSNFDPNYRGAHGLRLINYTLNAQDDEMSLMLMRHKKFERPIYFIDYSDEERYKDLEQKSKSLFSKIFKKQ